MIPEIKSRRRDFTKVSIRRRPTRAEGRERKKTNFTCASALKTTSLNVIEASDVARTSRNPEARLLRWSSNKKPRKIGTP